MTPYLSLFAEYEQKRESLATWVQRHYIEEFGLKPGRLLDAGCGIGFWSDLFVEKGFEVRGFDLDSGYIDQGWIKYPHLDLTVADAAKELPYELESFDVVFARGLSPFWAKDLEQMKNIVSNLIRYVSSDGLLLLGIYSNGSGRVSVGGYGGLVHHHRHTDYLALAAESGTVFHHAVKGNYLQIGVRP